MAKKINQEQTLSEEIYKHSRFFWTKIISILFITSLLGFMMTFPISDKIDGIIKGIMAGQSECTLVYDHLDVELFLPKVIFRNAKVSGSCIKNSTGELPLKDLTVSIRGPNLVPIGLTLATKIKIGRTELNLFPTISYNSMTLSVYESKIDHDFINTFAGDGFRIETLLGINALITIKGTEISEGKIMVESKNFTIKAQNVSGLSIPDLPLAPIDIRVAINKDNLDVRALNIGGELTPLAAKLLGTIKLNQFNLLFSKLDLHGQVKFSQQFENDFPLIKAYTSGRSSNNGYMEFELTGSPQMPRPLFK